MTVPEMIEVLQAFQQEKIIEWRYKSSTEWKEATTPVWDFKLYEYRIKPEPREYWIVIDTTTNYPLGVGLSPSDAKINVRTTSQGMKITKVREVLE